MANIICDGGRQNVLLLKSGIRQRYLLWTRLLNIILEFSDRVIREGKRIIKGTQIGKAEIKLSLTAGNTISYIKKKSDGIHKWELHRINKWVYHHLRTHSQLLFLYTSNEQIRITIASKSIKYLRRNMTKMWKICTLKTIQESWENNINKWRYRQCSRIIRLNTI